MTADGEVPLGAITEVVMGQAPPGCDCNQNGHGTVFVKAGEFGDHEPLVREWTTNPLKQARVGDVLVCVVGATAGKINASIDCAIGRSVAAVRPDAGRLLSRYLYHFLRTQVLYLRSKSQGLAQGVITREMLTSLLIPLPPNSEQRRIAEVLDGSEALWTKRGKSLAQLDSLSQAIFLDMFGDWRFETGSWPVIPLEGVVRETKLGLVRSAQEFGPNFPFPYVRMNAITRNGQLDLSRVQRTHATAAEIAAYQLQPGDLLFNTRNSEELVGKTALFRGGGLHLFNNNLMRIRLTDEADPEFIGAAFKTPFVQHALNARKSGTTSVFAIYYKDLRSLPLALPPIGLQHDFAKRVRAMERLKGVHRASLAEFDALFTSLQHRAFCGEL